MKKMDEAKELIKKIRIQRRKDGYSAKSKLEDMINAYDSLRDEMIVDGCWEEYCNSNNFSIEHTGSDVY